MKTEVVEFRGADDVILCADMVGEQQDVVLFLHGGGQTRRSWGKAAEVVARSGRRAISIDLRGHGDSGWSADGRYSLDLLVADLRAVIDQLGVLPVIVGASVGGVTALTAIGESDKPLARALILVDVTPRLNPEGAQRVQDFMREAPDGFLSVEEAAEAVSRYLPHRPRKPNVDGLRKNLRLCSSNGRFYWHWDPNFLSGDLIERDEIERRTAAAATRIAIPMLLVRGTQSEIVDEESVAHFRSLVPHAEWVDVGGAAHMIAGDMNDAFNSAVLTFLDQISYS